MSHDISMKRMADGATEGSDFQCKKRLKVADGLACDEPGPDNQEFVPLSMESLLAVPMEFIFHRSPGPRSKPLLTRSEAQCFIFVTLMAHELDSLITHTSTLCERRHVYEQFAQKLRHLNKNRRLMPLLCILHVLGQDLPEQALQKIKAEFLSVFAELRLALANLKQFSEQNWTLSESLMDAGPEGERVAREKLIVSDIQHEVCNRIIALLNENNMAIVNSFPCSESMEEYCRRKMNQDEPYSPQLPMSPPRPTINTTVDNQTDGSMEVSDLKQLPVKSKHLCASAEKENSDPSQSQRQEHSQQLQSSNEMERSDDGVSCSSDEDAERWQYGGATQNAAEALSSLMTADLVSREQGSDPDALAAFNG